MRTQEETEANKRAFLASMRRTGNITRAAAAAKVERRQHYNWLNEDPAYKEAFEDAQEEAADRLEEEARRRAETGVLEPVYQQGQKVGTIRRYSDGLLMFLLKGARPNKYAERVEARHRGSVAVSNADLSRLTDDELDIYERLTEKAAQRGTDPGGAGA